MPLPLKKRQVAAVDYIIKRIKGSDSYDRMKEHNESGEGYEALMMREKPEEDYSTGMRMAVDEMMNAVQSKDASGFEKGLRAFISMMLDAHEDEKELMKKNEM